MRWRRRIGYDNQPGRDTRPCACAFAFAVSVPIAFSITFPGSGTYTIAKLAGSGDRAHDDDLRGWSDVSVHRQQHHPSR